ncbi:hypothetical protein KKF34_03695 [Myxococcota bacterium]|nr:hypothetical protein [Myxococcota bacterium]MBU1382448.1 hypothetical protein [Myxococcota bacterium]MBU1495959.1 hypothetical protein [Myxococcota bacterium]
MKILKVIIATDKGYIEDFETLIARLYDRKIELFCAWGKYSRQWEDAMDFYITDPVRMDNSHHITTMSIDDEPFEDALNMVELWSVEYGSNDVEIIRL